MRTWLLLLAIGVAAAPSQGCRSIYCDEEVTQRTVAPDGRWLAATFVRNCGATTDFVTYAVVVDAGEEPHDSGKIWVAEAGTGPRSPRGGPAVRLRWLGPDRLLVAYGAGAEIFFQAVRLKGLRIEYREAIPAAAQPRGGRRR